MQHTSSTLSGSSPLRYYLTDEQTITRWVVTGPRLPDRIVLEKLVQVPVFGGGERAGKSPVAWGKQGFKRAIVIDVCGIPLGAIAAPANRHDSPILDETLNTLEVLGPLPKQVSVHLDRGYYLEATRENLRARGLASI